MSREVFYEPTNLPANSTCHPQYHQDKHDAGPFREWGPDSYHGAKAVEDEREEDGEAQWALDVAYRRGFPDREGGATSLRRWLPGFHRYVVCSRTDGPEPNGR